MILILSGKQVAEDLQIEFGEIPPIILPVGNRPLLDHIIEKIRLNNTTEKIIVSLPSGYKLQEHYKNHLKKNNIEISFVDSNFSLGKSLLTILAQYPPEPNEGILIHYGDTLLQDGIPNLNSFGSKNVVYSGFTEYNYSWLYLNEFLPNRENEILCGVIYLNNVLQLESRLIKHDFDMTAVFNDYKDDILVELRHDWLDFGHVNTYYNSKTIVSTERVFNRLQFDKYSIQKSSTNKKKLKAEADWFKSVPWQLVHNTPRIILTSDERNNFSYRTEYMFSPTLSELYVYGAHTYSKWRMIIDKCLNFLNNCRIHTPPAHQKRNSAFFSALVQKNEDRLTQYLSSPQSIGAIIKLEDESTWDLRVLLDKCHKRINPIGEESIVHGDFCFSNILFDFKKNDIVVIDPRGMNFNQEISNIGDIRYDLAKLLHSAIGKYDFIVSDNFSIQKTNSGGLECVIESPKIDLSDLVITLIENQGYNPKEILAITITLFISMLPLHYDKPDRQKAFIYTAITLFKGL